MKTLQGWILNNYCVTEQLYEGSRTIVYRGHRRDNSQQSVILKLLRREYPNFRELAQFRNQCTIVQGLDHTNVIQTYGLESYQNRDVLVMEDMDGISLSQAMQIWQAQADGSLGMGVGLTRFFGIASQVITALEGLYHHQVIHKDIKPANILINLKTQQVKLIDFSIASSLQREMPILTSANAVEGTLSYLSPEQTGRMNRGIDYRTDFYSLGVTLFELLTGQRPFTSTDPIEILHCHLAKQPPAAHHLNPEVPSILSAMIIKLMAKNAENRYQSAIGIQHDLNICWEQWQRTGQIVPFELGQQDQSDRFVIPDKLYGREADIATLLTAFNRIAEVDGNTGQAELVLVTGHSGTGKTAMIHEIYQPIVSRQGYFIQGKFDQFQRNVPFAALVQALRDLMGQLLRQSDSQVERWKLKILKALGENAAVLVEVIPELTHLIGAQPPAIELSGSAAQNRFNLLFQKFIQLFASKAHPLVIFIDDLQWADLATLRLMQVLMAETSRFLLFIAAYRDHEVTVVHPLMQIVEEIQKSGTPITSIALKPLNIEDLNQLVADSLNRSPETTGSLSQFIERITQGNPFFSSQLLKSWYEEGFITFDWSVRSWQFNLDEIQAQLQAEDVIDFMSKKLQKLPTWTQTALKIAACIGNQFDLSTLAIVSQESPAETTAAIYPALQEGLILLSKDQSEFQPDRTSIQTYQFLHDRVQQAAYGLIPDLEKPLVHLKIGQLLLANTPESDREEKIFAIVNALNYGSEFIKDLDQKDELSQLNLIAGRKAIAATAYTSAMEYLTESIYLLRDDCWEHDYPFTLELYELAIEAAALSGSLIAMENWADILFENAQCDLDRIRTYEIKIQSYSSQNRLLEAIELARIALQPLGFNIPMEPGTAEVEATFQATALCLGDRKIDDLADLPAMTDPNQLAIMSIVMSVMPAAFLAIPPLYPVLILSQVNSSVQYGNAPYSALCYACYGILLNGILKETNLANQFSKLANQLASQINSKDLTARTNFVIANFLSHSKFHLRETRPLLLESYQISLETGNIEYVGYCTQSLSHHSYLMGQELVLLEQEIRSYTQILAALNQITNLNYCQIFRQAILQMLVLNEQPGKLLGEACNEEELLPLLLEANDVTGLHFLYFNKLILNYCFEDFTQAHKISIQGKKYLAGGTGLISTPVYYFYDSLAALAVYSIDHSADILQQVTENQAELKHWATHAPMNHLHKFYLVEAERYRVLGQRAEAIDYYDRSIATAKENQYPNEEALAYEVAGRFYLDWGKETIAQSYFTDAYYCYGRWGAIAKIQDLENRYPHLLKPMTQHSGNRTNPSSTSSTSSTWGNSAWSTSAWNTIGRFSPRNTSQPLDLATVVNALQALSSEIQLEKLLTALMQSMLTHAGAEKCILLLSDHGNWLLSSKAINTEAVVILTPMSIREDNHILPQSVMNYVTRTSETLVIDNASTVSGFITDPYIIAQQPKSILCAPILHQGNLIGILYLENNLTSQAFTRDRLAILNLLTTQASISLQNAQLYENLEQKVEQRTQEINENNQQLFQTLVELKQTQSQLIQTEKMSSLGQMVAGVAHEINNPVNFIYGNLKYISEYAESLLDLVQVYESYYPQPLPEVEAKIDEIDLDFLRKDLPKILSSMKVGADRIREIVLSLRNFSRLDEAEMKPVDIHEGLDSTLLILQHRLTPLNQHAIQVIKNYSQLPEVTCFASQLNQVFMNLLSNAIDALDSDHPTISIHTEASQTNTVVIRISDNGMGIPDSVVKKIFDPFFTTKPIGSGTGLGLSVSYQIVVQKHHGTLTCHSLPEQGTEFTIEIPI